MSDFLIQAQELFPFTQQTRRDLHRHPELAYQEVRTAGIVAAELRSLGMEVTTGVAETGVVGLLEGSCPGPVVMLRFDMDALPIVETTGAEYASTVEGISHACGHDGHVAIGLTVARMLAETRSSWPGVVKFVFQPAEEGEGGAQRMVAAGVLEHPRPQRALGLHIWNEKPLGWIGVVPGPFMAGAETFWARITGRGGHGAVPNLAIDPVVAVAQVITALQTIVARNVSPRQAAVVSVTQVRAGEAFNVIPPYAELEGTIRSFEPAVRQRVLERFESILTGVSAALECTVELKVNNITPAVINDPATTEVVRQTAAALFPEATIDSQYQTMGAEDMAEFLNEIPGCYFMLGSANSSAGLDSAHHHPRFDFDEAVLPRAAALMAAAAVALLQE